MHKISLAALPALFAIGLAFSSVQAQTTATPAANAEPMAQPAPGTRNNMPAAKAGKAARADRKFIEEAAGAGMFEVQVAQLAVAKATDPQVKSFASMLVDHHTAANNDLIRIAGIQAVELPAAPKRTLRKSIERLGKKNGAEFERDFVRDVGVAAHLQDIKLFEKARKDVKHPELKAFVDKTLPTLREHLAQAQAMPQAGKPSGGRNTGLFDPKNKGS